MEKQEKSGLYNLLESEVTFMCLSNTIKDIRIESELIECSNIEFENNLIVIECLLKRLQKIYDTITEKQGYEPKNQKEILKKNLLEFETFSNRKKSISKQKNQLKLELPIKKKKKEGKNRLL